MSNAAVVVLMLGALAALVGLPGWLAHRLSNGNLSWREGTALVAAGLSVLFSDVAAVTGYRLPLMLGLNLALIAGLGIAAWRRGRLTPPPQPPSPPAGRGERAPTILYGLFVFGVFLAPALVMTLPYDTDAQGFGYLALMVREGGTVDTLAPWQPDVHYLYSPAFFIWSATFSDLLALPVHQVMLPLAHLAAGLMALLGLDLGRALTPDRPRVGWLLSLVLLGGFGLLTTLMDSGYTSVMGLLFVTLFLTLLFRGLQSSLGHAGMGTESACPPHPQPSPHKGERAQAPALRLPEAQRVGEGPGWGANWPRGSFAHLFRGSVLAAVALAAVPLTHPDTVIILLLGYIPFYATFWLSSKPDRASSLLRTPAALFRQLWLRWFIWIPALALALTIPWLARVAPLFLNSTIVSPFTLSPQHVQQLIVFNGVLPPIAALVGVVLAIRRRRPADVLMATWLLFILDFSLFGLTDRLASLVGLDVMRYVYPFSVAWRGPIIPYAYLAATALDWALSRIAFPRGLAFGLLGSGMAALALAVALSGPLIQASKPTLPIFGAFSSQDDLAAMAYLREHTPDDALILNYPSGFEGHWVPAVAERESVFFREQPFFAGAEPYYDRARELTPIYFDLAAPGAREALRRYGVTYVIVPQIVAAPERFAEMQRWRWPEGTWYPLASSPADAAWLEMVFEQNGAQVYRVSDP